MYLEFGKGGGRGIPRGSFLQRAFCLQSLSKHNYKQHNTFTFVVVWLAVRNIRISQVTECHGPWFHPRASWKAQGGTSGSLLGTSKGVPKGERPPPLGTSLSWSSKVLSEWIIMTTLALKISRKLHNIEATIHVWCLVSRPYRDSIIRLLHDYNYIVRSLNFGHHRHL